MKIRKNIISKLTQFKQLILHIVSISFWKSQLGLAVFLNKLGVPSVVAKIITKVHHKKYNYTHRYNIGVWKYVMILY